MWKFWKSEMSSPKMSVSKIEAHIKPEYQTMAGKSQEKFKDRAW